jgi:hypothetical protein
MSPDEHLYANKACHPRAEMIGIQADRPIVSENPFDSKANS